MVAFGEDECFAAMHLMGQDAIGEAVVGELVPVAAVGKVDCVLTRGDFQGGEGRVKRFGRVRAGTFRGCRKS